MSKPYYLLSDENLLAWSNTFSHHINAAPEQFGVTADQASAFEALTSTFNTTLAAWRDNSTKTPVAFQNKMTARGALVTMAKYLVSSINSNPATTDAQRDELGIKARKKPTPIPAPSQSPFVKVLSVSGQTVTLSLSATQAGKRGKPSGVKGASVFTFVGAVAPTDPAAWKFEGLVTKTKFPLTFDGSTAAATVWVTANWFNERGQTGIACSPVSINLPAATIVPQPSSMKIAA